MAMKKADRSGLPAPMPLAPGNAKASQPPPAHVTAAHAVPPYLAPEKQRFTTPAPVSKVQGLEAGTVLPPAAIQPMPGFQIR